MSHPHTRLDTLWFTRCPVPTAIGVAADRGWLAAEFTPDGIAVRSLQERSIPVSRESHFTHTLTGLIREGGNVPALWARSRGEATRLIGLTWYEERQAILVRADDDLDHPARLRGRRVAIPHHPLAIDFWRAMALAGFAGALRAGGLGLADVDLVEVAGVGGPSQWRGELAALRDGVVDAVYVKGALAVQEAQRHGARVAINLDTLDERRHRVNNGTPRPVTVHQDLLDRHPDLVTRFLAVLLAAADWAASNPAELARILSDETGAGAAGVAAAYQPQGAVSLCPDLSSERLDLLDQQAGFLNRHGFLDTPVDVATWADPEPLRAARQLAHAKAEPTAHARTQPAHALPASAVATPAHPAQTGIQR